MAHKKCYLAWREFERRLEESSGVDMLNNERILSEAQKWKIILARIIHVVVFLGERGPLLRGSSQRMGDIHSGNFIGLIERLATMTQFYKSMLQKFKYHRKKLEDCKLTIFSIISKRVHSCFCIITSFHQDMPFLLHSILTGKGMSWWKDVIMLRSSG